MYTVGNLLSRQRVSKAVYPTIPNEHFEYGYPHSNELLLLSLQLNFFIVLSEIGALQAACHPTKCDVQ